MKEQKSIYEMTDRELRAYKRSLKQKIAFRRKCMMCVMTLCLIIACAVSYHSIKSSANTGEDLTFKYYTNITVSYGETLWDIADIYMDYEQYDDKAEYIAEVKNINHLDAEGNIKAGQFLVVPYFSQAFIQ